MSQNEGDIEPTILIMLERMNAMEERLTRRIDRIETLLDLVAAAALETRDGVRVLKAELRERFPFVN
jgi:hypothetical protein